MMKHLSFLATMLIATSASANVVDQLLQSYQQQGATAFNGDVGKSLWTKSFGTSSDGYDRKCSTCHTTDLRRAGKHAKTGKSIEPLAPSANSKRLSDAAEIEKWLKRNCQWTLGRECNAQEKGDFLTFIRTQ